MGAVTDTERKAAADAVDAGREAVARAARALTAAAAVAHRNLGDYHAACEYLDDKVLALAKALRAELPRLQEEMPAGFQINIGYDSTLGMFYCDVANSTAGDASLVITDVPDDSKIMTQEPFGPLAPIVTFKTFDEVVQRANSLEFGLAAYAFTSSNTTAAAIGDAIESGMVGINSIAVSTPETPFGGVKESGHGSEGGSEGLSAYLNTKFISQG